MELWIAPGGDGHHNMHGQHLLQQKYFHARMKYGEWASSQDYVPLLFNFTSIIVGDHYMVQRVDININMKAFNNWH